MYEKESSTNHELEGIFSFLHVFAEMIASYLHQLSVVASDGRSRCGGTLSV